MTSDKEMFQTNFDVRNNSVSICSEILHNALCRRIKLISCINYS